MITPVVLISALCAFIVVMRFPRILTDTLQEKDGKWSIKRLAGISGFFVAALYAFTPIVAPKFPVHEFVFWGFITFAATAILGTVWNKKIELPNTSGKTKDNE